MQSWMRRSKSGSSGGGPSGPGAATAAHCPSQTERTGPVSATEVAVGSGSVFLAAATGLPLNPTWEGNPKGSAHCSLFSHLFNIHLVSACCMPGTVLGSGNIA